MKRFNQLFVFIFILFAVVQYNDPDPYLWIPIYLFPAVLCFLATREKFYKNVYTGGFIFYSLYADGYMDSHSLHAACPVGQNQIKYAANKWIWTDDDPHR